MFYSETVLFIFEHSNSDIKKNGPSFIKARQTTQTMTIAVAIFIVSLFNLNNTIHT